MYQPVEMRRSYPIKLVNDIMSTTSDVWSILVASRAGNLAQVDTLVRKTPALATCMYDYTTPLQFAVLWGHAELVRHLLDMRVLDARFLNHPFRESLAGMARDRGFERIAQLLDEAMADPARTHPWGDNGDIQYGKDETEHRFQRAVDQSLHDEVEGMLRDRPSLALDETAFWGEGILSMPAKDGDWPMVELLMQNGARVPDYSKWGARYYFKRYDMSQFLLRHGATIDHRNWREFTLLHDMAFVGDVERATLFLDHGASINAIDEEYQSAPLGYAAHWDREEMVSLLLERGADPNAAGAPWARPLAWAERRGHGKIAEMLRVAGAE